MCVFDRESTCAIRRLVRTLEINSTLISPYSLFVLSPLQGLLSAPEPDDPLDTNVAEHWKTNEKAAMEKAKEWTLRYASQREIERKER